MSFPDAVEAAAAAIHAGVEGASVIEGIFIQDEGRVDEEADGF